MHAIVCLFYQAAEALNEHLRQIENETKVVEVIKSFPNDELVSSYLITSVWELDLTLNYLTWPTSLVCNF